MKGLVSCVWLSATSWTVARQALVVIILQARILKWVANSFSRGFSQTRDRIQVSCIAGRFFTVWSFPCGSAGKGSSCNVGDLGYIPGSGRSSGEGKGYPLQYSGVENSMDCIVHGVAKSRARWSDFHFHFSLTSEPLGKLRKKYKPTLNYMLQESL